MEEFQSCRLQAPVYYEIQANEQGIHSAAQAYGITDPDVIKEIISTHAELERICIQDITIGHVLDAFALHPGNISVSRLERMYDLGETH